VADGVDWGASWPSYGVANYVSDPQKLLPSPRTDDMAHEELQAENARLLEQIRAIKLHLDLCHDCTWEA